MTFRLRPKRRSLKEEKLVTKPGDGGIIPGIGSGFCRGLEVGKRRQGQVGKRRQGQVRKEGWGGMGQGWQGRRKLEPAGCSG